MAHLGKIHSLWNGIYKIEKARCWNLIKVIWSWPMAATENAHKIPYNFLSRIWTMCLIRPK
jgi:hypothetical protein